MDNDSNMPNIDAPTPALSCNYYCNTIQTACTGANAQYESSANCLTTCALLPAGTLGMTLTDTLGCRISHAMTAFGNASMAAAECPKAGPAGDGLLACGTTCEAFCGIIDNICPSQWNAGTCVAQCNARGAVTHYSTANQTGDTRECRLYWATVGTCANTVRNSNPVCQ